MDGVWGRHLSVPGGHVAIRGDDQDDDSVISLSDGPGAHTAHDVHAPDQEAGSVTSAQTTGKIQHKHTDKSRKKDKKGKKSKKSKKNKKRKKSGKRQPDVQTPHRPTGAAGAMDFTPINVGSQSFLSLPSDGGSPAQP